jgi:hypothetical protein
MTNCYRLTELQQMLRFNDMIVNINCLSNPPSTINYTILNEYNGVTTKRKIVEVETMMRKSNIALIHHIMDIDPHVSCIICLTSEQNDAIKKNFVSLQHV